MATEKKKKTKANQKPSPVFPGDHIITSTRLIRIMQDSTQNGSRFCFILGSGASVESGILSGKALERAWMDCLMGVSKDRDTEPFSPDETRELAGKLRENGRLQYDFSVIEENWNNARMNNRSMDSRYYFDIFKLRFYPDKKLGFRYLEKIMENAQPSLGYHTLALILAEDKGNNLVVTLNFDSLVEDSLYLYTNKKPLVINHELLADYLDCNAVTRPLIAKLHHGLFFDPINDTKELPKNWKKSWREILKYVFYTYTPIVIGYGGGDNSLMEILKDKQIPIRNGMYWCTCDNPLEEDFNDDIRKLVKARNGHFVLIDGFNSLMLEMGKVFFDGQIEPDATKELWDQQVKERMEKYEKQYHSLIPSNNLNVSHDAKEFLNLGISCWINNKYGDAIENLSKAIELDSSDAFAYLVRGFARNELKEYGKAIDDFSKAIEFDPSHTAAYYNRGDAWNELKEYGKAIDDFSTAINLDPSDAAAYYNRGNAWIKLKEYGKAIDDFSKAIEFDPSHAAAYNNRGYVWNELEEYNKAIDDFSRAIELDPSYAKRYNNRGATWNELKEYRKAIDDCSKAIELNPSYANPYNHRGYAWNGLKEYDKAITDYTKAIELNPSYIVAYRNRAATYDALNHPDLAEADRKKAAELESKTT